MDTVKLTYQQMRKLSPEDYLIHRFETTQELEDYADMLATNTWDSGQSIARDCGKIIQALLIKIKELNGHDE